MQFTSLNQKKVEASFTGGSITSDGGLLLLRELDKKQKIIKQLCKSITDSRHQGYVEHTTEDLLRQRVYALASGYPDINDHDQLNRDLCFQTSVGREVRLASSATLSRFENSIDRESLMELSKTLVELFIQSHKQPPREVILDFDPTDNILYVNQEGRHYHGYYKTDCYLPLHVFCGDKLLVSMLRPSNIPILLEEPYLLRT